MVAAQCIGFLNTPPLWNNRQFDIQQFDFPNLVLDSFQPKAIPPTIRLGHQMEYIFRQLVEHSEAYTVELYNLPIRQRERTLGEIDFILKDKAKDQLIHVELTYKFYIINSQISDPIYSLIGPNRRDTFVTKMEKIKNVQFSLLHTPEGSQVLRDFGIDHLRIEHQCCFKAQLFRPYTNKSVSIGPLNKNCLAGHWLRFHDFNKAKFSNAQYYLPNKSEWVIKPHDQVAWKSHVKILIDINSFLIKERAPMVWMKSNAEIQKLFVVW